VATETDETVGRVPPGGAAAAGPLLASALWGGMYVVSKWGFAAVPPVTLTFLRLAVGAVTLLVVVRLTRPRRAFSPSERRRFVGLGALVGLTLVAQFVGTDLTNASQGSLLTVLTPVFTLALGVVVLGESLTRRKASGMTLAAVGTLVVVGGQSDLSGLATGNLVGVAALLVGSLGWAGYTVFGASLVRRYSAVEAATYSTLAAVPLVGLLVPVELFVLDAPLTSSPTPALAAAVVYLGVLSTAAAWVAWYAGLDHADAGTVAVFFFAQPVVGSLLGATLLDERLGAGFLLGGGVMALGVYLVSAAPNGSG
jgi:drug/metabolite transporter (DMT)-like permease